MVTDLKVHGQLCFRSQSRRSAEFYDTNRVEVSDCVEKQSRGYVRQFAMRRSFMLQFVDEEPIEMHANANRKQHGWEAQLLQI